MRLYDPKNPGGFMTRSLQRSSRHHKMALQKLPLGVSSNFRYRGKDKTIYVDHAKDGHLWNIDGNEYVDYRMSYGIRS
jgi:glutamate-1-semialdehyde 2,1-aminomutase